MRLMQVMAGASHGGAENFFEKLCIAMNDKIHQRVVIRSDFHRYNRLRQGGIDAVQLPFGGALDFKTSRELKKMVNEFKPDVVITWMNRATKKMPKGPFVHIARLGGYYNLKYYQNCDHLVGNTKDIVRWLVEEQMWPEDQASYISNFTNEEIKGEAFSKTNFDTPENMPVILCLGRLHQNKAFDTAIRAMEHTENCHLWIAGTGPEEQALKALTVELGLKERVRFLGWREDIADLLKTADLFLCPSRHEPLGNVILESWFHGTPIVAAKSQGPVELIKHGESGLLFDIDNSEACAKMINKAFESKSATKKLATAGKKAYKEGFSEKFITSQYIELFQHLCQNTEE